MPRRHDDWDELDEDEYPDLDPSDDDTAPCPHCGKAVYDDSERCPHCGTYLSEEDTPTRKPLWVVLGVLLCLGIVWFCWVWPG
jgi:hypothetical protein